MRGKRHLRRHAQGSFSPRAGQRRFVIREGVGRCYVLAHHPYGRVQRLRHPDGSFVFRGLHEALDAVAAEVLRRTPDGATQRELRLMVSGAAPRWEVSEADVRLAAQRRARVA